MVARRIARVALAGLLAVAAVAGAEEPLVVESIWAVSLDASGHVVSLESHVALKPVLRDPLAKAIRGWSFEPGRVDGQPVPTETSLQLSVSLEADAAGNYQVRVVDVRIGAEVASSVPPRFPTRLVRRIKMPFSGLVVAEVRYDAEGKVLEAGLAPGTPSADPLLQEAALASIRKWRFQPERVGGHPLAGSAWVPLCFTLTTSARNIPDCEHWTPPGANTPVPDGTAFALQPAATLRSEVIGHLL
jgi:TonB family protein